MNLTLGDEHELNEAKVLQILERQEQEIAQPLQDRIDQISADHLTALDRLSRREAQLCAIEEGITRICSGVRNGVRISLVGISAFLLFAAHRPFGPPTSNALPLRMFYGILGWVLITATILNLVSGFRVIDPLDRFCSWMERRLGRCLNRLFHLD